MLSFVFSIHYKTSGYFEVYCWIAFCALMDCGGCVNMSNITWF